MQVFNKEKALELVDGDESLLEILLDSFRTENSFEREHLDKLFNEGNFSEAAGYVHATKGAARQLCMEKLQTSGQNLEDFLRMKTQGSYEDLADKMFSDYKEALSFIS